LMHLNPRKLETVAAVVLVVMVVVAGFIPYTRVIIRVNACTTCNFLLTWGSAATFNIPSGVAVDSSGNVYVTDTLNNRIEKFSSTGTFITEWGSSGSLNGEFNSPIGVAVDSLGNVFVTDSVNNRVEKFTSTGTFITKWGTLGTGNGAFNGPTFLATDPSGNVYVTDTDNTRVQKFSNTGAFITKWGSFGSGPSEFESPYGIAVDSAGNVYVADHLTQIVQKFSSSGAFLLSWGTSGTGPGQFSQASGVAVDSSGNVYVTDTTNFRVEEFTSKGIYVTAWGCADAGQGCLGGSVNGQFESPFGIAVDSFGNAYVVDSTNDRVELFGDSVLASISLHAGWNLVSLPLVPLNSGITSEFSGLTAGGNFTVIWSYQGGKWLFFMPTGKSTLTSMVDGFGYWVSVTTNSTLSVLGNTVPPGATPSAYPLTVGWNLVGFTPQVPSENETLGTYLTSIGSDYAIVRVYDNLNATWIKGIPSLELAPSEAMWIYMNTAATLIPE